MNPLDPQFLLKVMWDEWNTIFRKKLGRTERNYVSELQDARNKWAHNEAFTAESALRAMDTAKLLLESVGAGPHAAQVDALHQELLRRRFEEEAKRAQKKAAAHSTTQEKSLAQTGLPAWREVVEPHDDVASGRFQLAEFAADLHQVWRGEAPVEYDDPAEFYRRTYITEGLSSLIVGAARRFSGSGGDPVIQLQTNFGGGKTHALIALYHLAGETPVTQLKGVEELLAGNGLELPSETIRRAVLVGHQLLPGETSVKDDGTVVHTMWGELAHQLGGAEGYALVAEADQTGTSPRRGPDRAVAGVLAVSGAHRRVGGLCPPALWHVWAARRIVRCPLQLRPGSYRCGQQHPRRSAGGHYPVIADRGRR